ncbi:hypothetical protein Vafri_16522 [Volvox africanus]|nr:hypothetical protein Vafri_16522 [Volvox africanus]GIL62329.1 hypothetical protein Vafri_16522 [Volvox africanus]
MDITHSEFCAPTIFPAWVPGTTRMEMVPRFYASAGLVEADGGSALVANSSSQPSMLGVTFCGVDEDVKDAGNHLDSVKERDLLFPTVALESFEAVLLQEELSSAASAIDAKSQTTPSTDDASLNTLYSRNHSKQEVVHISICAVDMFPEVHWTARTNVIIPRAHVPATLMEVDGVSVVVANSSLPLKHGPALWGSDEDVNVKGAETRADFVTECDPTTLPVVVESSSDEAPGRATTTADPSPTGVPSSAADVLSPRLSTMLSNSELSSFSLRLGFRSLAAWDVYGVRVLDSLLGGLVFLILHQVVCLFCRLCWRLFRKGASCSAPARSRSAAGSEAAPLVTKCRILWAKWQHEVFRKEQTVKVKPSRKWPVGTFVWRDDILMYVEQ